MALKDRIRRLENADGGGCGECGWPNVTFNLIWRDAQTPDEPEREPELREPEHCPGCGRPLRISLEWTETLHIPETKITNEGEDDDA